MTTLQDKQRTAKTLAENEQWLIENATKIVRRNESESVALDRWNDEGGSSKDGSQQ